MNKCHKGTVRDTHTTTTKKKQKKKKKKKKIHDVNFMFLSLLLYTIYKLVLCIIFLTYSYSLLGLKDGDK